MNKLEALNGKLKHTPGPWEINGLHIITKRSDELGYYSIATVLQPVKQTPHKANAHLIASAPELLEACKEAKKFIDKEWPGIDYCSFLTRIIAKAEGF